MWNQKCLIIIAEAWRQTCEYLDQITLPPLYLSMKLSHARMKNKGGPAPFLLYTVSQGKGWFLARPGGTMEQVARPWLNMIMFSGVGLSMVWAFAFTEFTAHSGQLSAILILKFIFSKSWPSAVQSAQSSFKCLAVLELEEIWNFSSWKEMISAQSTSLNVVH